MPDIAKNKVKWGLKNVHYAIATIAADGSATFGTPVAIPGAVNLSMEAQGERAPFYADDVEYYTSISNDGYEGDLEIAIVPESFEVDVLGAEETAKKVLVEKAGTEPVHFALLFEFKGDKKKVRHVLYNCTATRPSIEGETKGESIEPKTDTLSLKSSSIYNATLQEDIVKAKTKSDTDADTYNGWFSAVYQPAAASESQPAAASESQEGE